MSSIAVSSTNAKEIKRIAAMSRAELQDFIWDCSARYDAARTAAELEIVGTEYAAAMKFLQDRNYPVFPSREYVDRWHVESLVILPGQFSRFGEPLRAKKWVPIAAEYAAELALESHTVRLGAPLENSNVG